MQNAHSFRVAKILSNFGGIKVMIWNLTNWIVISERSVQFTICKELFFGAIRVTQALDDANVFVVSYRKISEEQPTSKRINAITLATYIESLTVAKVEAAPVYPLERAEGHRVPNLENITQAA